MAIAKVAKRTETPVVTTPAPVLVSPQGAPGLSAYQVALNNGFNGTEAQWLNSLKVNVAGGITEIRAIARSAFEAMPVNLRITTILYVLTD